MALYQKSSEAMEAAPRNRTTLARLGKPAHVLVGIARCEMTWGGCGEAPFGISAGSIADIVVTGALLSKAAMKAVMTVAGGGAAERDRGRMCREDACRAVGVWAMLVMLDCRLRHCDRLFCVWLAEAGLPTAWPFKRRRARDCPMFSSPHCTPLIMLMCS
jgi:hypothetical protein